MPRPLFQRLGKPLTFLRQPKTAFPESGITDADDLLAKLFGLLAIPGMITLLAHLAYAYD
jgi:hypothetical protein